MDTPGPIAKCHSTTKNNIEAVKPADLKYLDNFFDVNVNFFDVNVG